MDKHISNADVLPECNLAIRRLTSVEIQLSTTRLMDHDTVQIERMVGRLMLSLVTIKILITNLLNGETEFLSKLNALRGFANELSELKLDIRQVEGILARDVKAALATATQGAKVRMDQLTDSLQYLDFKPPVEMQTDSAYQNDLERALRLSEADTKKASSASSCGGGGSAASESLLT